MDEFLFQIEYNKKNHKITLYSITSSGETKYREIEYIKPIFILKEDFIKLQLNSNDFEIKEGFLSYDKREIIKFNFKTPEFIEEFNELIKMYNLEVFENDIQEQHYYTIDTQLEIKNPIKANRCKVLSLDIETLGDENNQYINLISLSSYDKSFENRVYINESVLNSKFSNLKEQNSKFKEKFDLIWCLDEKELLEKLKEDIMNYQPQFILGWNVISFDFKVIKERFTKYGIEFKLSQFEGDYKFRISNDFFGKSTLSFPGILVLDCIQVLRTNYIQFSDYKLNSVAQEVLGENKVDLDNSEESDYSIADKIKAIEYNWNHDPLKLIWYNYKDSTLVLDIVEKLNLLDLLFERSIITQTPIERLQSPIGVLDQMYLKELHNRSNVAKTHYPTNGNTPIEGAHVIDPKSGFYEDIIVFDFASLYPSIMITFNIDPFTYSNNGEIVAPNGAKFESEKGILPTILKKLFELRVKAKQEKDSIKSHALKITMNSFYGAMASQKARYYNKHLAEAITSYGRECLIHAKEYLEEKHQLEVIYGDTDSVFVKGNFGKISHDEKKKIMRELEDDVNEHFSIWVKDTFGVDSFLKLEAEKLFDSFFIASKKRYVGLEKGKELQFVGMEAIRGDWTPLAQEFQIKLITLIFENKGVDEIKKFILNEIDFLKKKKFDEKLVYTKKITKPLSEYTKTTPPHVKAAREIDNFNGRVVKYVMTNQGPKHISLYQDHLGYDYEHYIDKQLKGVSDDILKAFGVSFETIVEEKKQTSLNKFF